MSCTRILNYHSTGNKIVDRKTQHRLARSPADIPSDRAPLSLGHTLRASTLHRGCARARLPEIFKTRAHGNHGNFTSIEGRDRRSWEFAVGVPTRSGTARLKPLRGFFAAAAARGRASASVRLGLPKLITEPSAVCLGPRGLPRPSCIYTYFECSAEGN